jgi:hypothetical protein
MHTNRPGRQVALGLAGLALAAITGTIVLSLLPDRADRSSAVEAIVVPPWAACMQEARRQLGAPGLPIQGPTTARWDASGEAVELSGAAGQDAVRPLAFGCQVLHVGRQWVVQRLVFADR